MPLAQFFLSDCQTVFWNESYILKGVEILRIFLIKVQICAQSIKYLVFLLVHCNG